MIFSYTMGWVFRFRAKPCQEGISMTFIKNIFPVLLVMLFSFSGSLYAFSERENAWFDAVISSDAQKLEELIEDGVDLEARDNEERTALALAISARRGPEIVGLLLEAGVKVETRDTYGWTPLIAAALTERPETIKNTFGCWS